MFLRLDPPGSIIEWFHFDNLMFIELKETHDYSSAEASVLEMNLSFEKYVLQF
jgi:hypothetical protein